MAQAVQGYRAYFKNDIHNYSAPRGNRTGRATCRNPAEVNCPAYYTEGLEAVTLYKQFFYTKSQDVIPRLRRFAMLNFRIVLNLSSVLSRDGLRPKLFERFWAFPALRCARTSHAAFI